MGLGFDMHIAALRFCFEHFLYIVKETGHFDGRWDDLKEVRIKLREDEYVVYDSVEGEYVSAVLSTMCHSAVALTLSGVASRI